MNTNYSYKVSKVKHRGFEVVPSEFRKNDILQDNCYFMPKRATLYSAGYDIYLNHDFIIEPKKTKVYWTDICAYMKNQEVLKVYIRSSIAIKKNVVLTNHVGIVDKDYYSNKKNYGNIGLCLTNNSNKAVLFERGDSIAQGIFSEYIVADKDIAIEHAIIREGGVGSTNK